MAKTTSMQVAVAGVNVNIKGLAGDAETYDAMNNEIGSCVESANRNFVYRAHLPKIRPVLLSLLEEHTGIKCPDSGDTTEKGEPIKISEVKFVNFLKAGGKITDADLAEIAQRAADSVPVEYTGTSRRTPGKAEMDAAEQFLAAIDPSELEEKLEKLSARTGINIEFDENGQPLAASVARAIKVAVEMARKNPLGL